MEIIKTPLEGLLVIKPKVFGDDRGYFFESWSKQSFTEVGLDLDFVQDNQSLSGKGVLRGLHFQNPPYAQGKLVRVIKGAVLDVCVDIRKDSPTYGQHFSVELSEENKTAFWIPPGFAHGYVVLSEFGADITYKVTREYDPHADSGIRWDDPKIGVSWPISDPILSPKDRALPTLAEANITGYLKDTG